MTRMAGPSAVSDEEWMLVAPYLVYCPRIRGSASPCARCSTGCATWPGRTHPGAGCPTTCHRGHRLRPGTVLAGGRGVRSGRTTCGSRRSWKRGVGWGRQPSFSTAAPYARRSRAGPERATTGPTRDGQQGARGRGHAGPPTGPARRLRYCRRPCRSRLLVQGGLASDRRSRRGHLCRPGPYRRTARPGRCRARHLAQFVRHHDANVAGAEKLTRLPVGI